jgi:hypothetical protein
VTGSLRIPGALRERGSEPGCDDFELPRGSTRSASSSAPPASTGNGVLLRQTALPGTAPCALILAAAGVAAADIAV